MKKSEKYIITRIRFTYSDGTHSTTKIRKEVYNVNSYRDYLMVKYNAVRVEFNYESIPVESQGEIRLKV
jgi:hypothetical protein